MAFGTVYDRNEFSGALGGLFDRRKAAEERKSQEATNALRSAQTANLALEAHKKALDITRYKNTAGVRKAQDALAIKKAESEMATTIANLDRAERTQAIEAFGNLPDDADEATFSAWRENLSPALRKKMPTTMGAARTYVKGARNALVYDVPTRQAIAKETAEQAAIQQRELSVKGMEQGALDRRSRRSAGVSQNQLMGRAIALREQLKDPELPEEMRPVYEAELDFLNRQREAELEKLRAESFAKRRGTTAKGSTRVMTPNQIDDSTFSVTNTWLSQYTDPQAVELYGPDTWMGAEEGFFTDTPVPEDPETRMVEAEQRLQGMDNFFEFDAAVRQSMSGPGGTQLDGIEESQKWVPLPEYNRIVKIPEIPNLRGEGKSGTPTLHQLKFMSQETQIPLGEMLIRMHRRSKGLD